MQYFDTIYTFVSNLIKRYPKEFVILIFFISIESIIIAFSVLSIIPFADFLLDPELTNPSKYTKLGIEFLNLFNIKPGYIVFASIFVLSNLLRSFINLLIKYRVLKIKFAIQKSFSKEILNKIFLSKWTFFNNLSYGKIFNTFTKEIDFIGSASRSIGDVFSSFLSIITFVAIPLIIEPKMSFLIIGCCFLLGLPFLLLSKTSKKLGQERTNAGNKYYAKLTETVQAAKLIMGFGLGGKQTKFNFELLDKYVNKDLNSQFINLISIYLFKPLAIILLIMIFGTSFELQNVPSYAAIFWSLYGALPLIGHIFNTAVVINNYQPSYNQIDEIIKRAEEHFEKNGQIELNDIKKNIIFENVGFSYGNKKILNNFNLTIKKNKITVLIGESGSGKTTVLDLLMSLQKKNAGKIKINDYEIEQLDYKFYRKLIGYVPQDPVLFFSTIKENMMWSKENLNNAEIIEALKLANAYDFIMKFPNKLETQVGEKGTEISGGQRQRIALARAIVRKPKLLILDEPTSSVDSESQHLIKESLNKITNFSTIIMATHEKSTIEIAHEIYEVYQGQSKNIKTS